VTTVFTLLAAIGQRPAMYIGGKEAGRRRQLENLETLLTGYACALQAHGIVEPITNFNRSFSEYLYRTRGWSGSCGPAVAVFDATADEERGWSLYWDLVNEFEAIATDPSRG
jgi:hypothetical protein